MLSLFLDPHCLYVSMYLYCTQSQFLCEFLCDFYHQSKYRLYRFRHPRYNTRIVSTRDTIFRYFD